MKYKISNAYIIVNGEEICVGTVLGEEDKPESPFMSDIIPNSEYQKGLKEFKYGQQRIGDLVYHIIGRFVDFKSTWHIDEKWFKELELMGYDISKLINMNEDEEVKS